MECRVTESISHCLYSVSTCSLVQLSKYVLCCSLKTARLYCMISLLTDYCHDCTTNGDEDDDKMAVEEKEIIQEEIALSYCEKHDAKDELTYEDVNTIMSNLCVEGWRKIEKQDKDLIQGANELLEDKHASLVELKEAFYVFDRDEDGFITPFELWSVLRRLGLKEGMRYEDCEEMIRVHDKDDDGRISFSEFKSMMEQCL
ncbi:Calcium-binding EF-hand family protein [Rhynchospora pubera]|uniref:Calcium-binding EF-hand family protein n=1 Tax=Rhynchospora pubera TaxID=906938 RepID=A0AAV8D484_9POAL|nr:Calcium-binding EF-hand family protein [Rhynchospora pubera]